MKISSCNYLLFLLKESLYDHICLVSSVIIKLSEKNQKLYHNLQKNSILLLLQRSNFTRRGDLSIYLFYLDVILQQY